MKFTLTSAWLAASWRESQRLRQDAMDVDHQYLGLLGIGGAAARLLGEHGITLASARNHVRDALTQDLSSLGITELTLPAPLPFLETGTGRFAETARAKVITDASAASPDTFALLVALLQEPSGLVRRLVHADGVLPQDLVGALRAGSTDPFRAETTRATGGILPAPAFARRITTYVPVPRDQAVDALARPQTLRYVSMFADADVTADGLSASVRQGSREAAVGAELLASEPHADHHTTLTWRLRALDGRHAGQAFQYHRFTMRDAPGGAELDHEHGFHTFGLLGRLVEPLTRPLAEGFGMQHSRYALAAYVSESD